MTDLETVNELKSRLSEIDSILDYVYSLDQGIDENIVKFCLNRKADIETRMLSAKPDLSSDILRSHKALCEAKNMGPKEAYGNDPAVYYTLGVCGEAGEMANAVVKAQRNGNDKEKVLAAVKSELPDVIIYSFILAYVLDIDLPTEVREKVDIVIARAKEGYYGAPLTRVP